MFNIILGLLGYFGGLLFFLLDLATFKVNSPRAIKLLEFILACVPIVGFIVMLGFYIAKLFCHSHHPWYNAYEYFEPCVRYNAINRYLFNDIDWNEYDKHEKERKAEEERELANELYK